MAGSVASLAMDTRARLGGGRERGHALQARLPLLTLLTAAAGVAALLAVLYTGLKRNTPVGTAGVNATGGAVRLAPRPAPEISLPLLGGGTFRLGDYRGQAVVVNFWASWCAPCREEAAALERGWQRWGARGAAGEGVQFVGVNLWDTATGAGQFLEQVRPTYPMAGDTTGETAIAYGVRGLPETFFVDRQGQLVRKWIGPLDERQLAASLSELAGPDGVRR